MKKLLLLVILLLSVAAYAAEILQGGTPLPESGGTPPCKSGGTPPCDKLPGILVCDGYADKPEAVLKCKGYNKAVSKMKLDELYVKGYRLVQVVTVKGELVYYFQRQGSALQPAGGKRYLSLRSFHLDRKRHPAACL